jgi:hypothetical protein
MGTVWRSSTSAVLTEFSDVDFSLRLYFFPNIAFSRLQVLYFPPSVQAAHGAVRRLYDSE